MAGVSPEGSPNGHVNGNTTAAPIAMMPTAVTPSMVTRELCMAESSHRGPARGTVWTREISASLPGADPDGAARIRSHRVPNGEPAAAAKETR